MWLLQSLTWLHLIHSHSLTIILDCRILGDSAIMGGAAETVVAVAVRRTAKMATPAARRMIGVIRGEDDDDDDDDAEREGDV